MTDAYRAGLVQVRYMKNPEGQQDTFLQDAGIVLRLMTEIMRELKV